MSFFSLHTFTFFSRLTQGRTRSALFAYSGCSALPPLIIFLFFYATPTLSLIPSCSKENAATAPPPGEPVTLQLQVKSPAGAPPVSGADIFIYNSDSGALDAYQHWDASDADDDSLLIVCSSKKIPRTVMVASGLSRDWEWGQIRSIDSLREALVSLDEDRPEAAPVLSGWTKIGDGFDETCTVTLRPLLCRVRLHSLTCDFSGRPYYGETLQHPRAYLINAGCESALFPDDAAPPYPSGYRNMGADCGELPVIEGTEGVLYCYPNPATDDGLGTPMTRLVIEGELLGRTWYYPITLPQPLRNHSYDFDITLTMTGADNPDTPVDGTAAQIALAVVPWDEQPEQIVPFRQTDLLLSVKPASVDPKDPDRISDLNLLVYTADGILQEQRYLPARSFSPDKPLTVHLLENLSYSFVTCANLGYALPALDRDALTAYRYHMAYPDEYSQGLPMSAIKENFVAGSAQLLTLPLERLLARVSLSLDRSCLSSDVTMDVRSVRVGNGPRSVLLFGESRAETEADLFQQGFYKDGVAVAPLNLRTGSGRSGSIDLYIPENVQGLLLPEDTDPKQKVLEEPVSNVATYIELTLDYQSDSYYTDFDHWLTYRFYPGESPGDFSLRRGRHYEFVLTPEDDGLQGHPWRIDKSRLGVHNRFNLFPAAYNECSSSESFRIWCDVTPPTTPMTIEPLAYDDDERVEELYDYEIDPDGYGITIHPHKGGTALIYFSAGPPVSRDTLALLRIDP